MPPRLAPTLSRRRFLAVVGLSAIGAACSDPARIAPSIAPPSSPTSPGEVTTDRLRRGATPLTLLGTTSPIHPGAQRFGFDLQAPSGGLVTAGSPAVYLATAEDGPALGPFPATWHLFTAYDLTADRSPRSPIPGVYAAEVTVPSPGDWIVAAVIQNGAQRAVGVTALPVTGSAIPAALGSTATSIATPVATTASTLREICTRTPPCRLHAISLSDALANGKPTVAGFATPLLCQTQLCGPVIDEQILAARSIAPQANVIHVEEFLPGPTLTPPAPTLQNRSPAFKAWRFTTEPWIVVVDGSGIIRDRFEGPVVSSEIVAAVRRVQ